MTAMTMLQDKALEISKNLFVQEFPNKVNFKAEVIQTTEKYPAMTVHVYSSGSFMNFTFKSINDAPEIYIG